MSTYFYLVCDSCRESVPAVSRMVVGHESMAGHEKALLPFIIKHSGHPVRICHEWDEPEGFVEWSNANWEELEQRHVLGD